ncbi:MULTISPECIES: hypothetical protein [Methylorubrum]|uniref:hypothetical protein n=1 Tax=Methylorubrum TaxID=2282523 RepID=UPI0020A00803|nr:MULTISPECIES: hypothetical protein [Methylorubrum]MCP1551701.1 hypothetical protein [Methylorubrum zatmanii]MCP1556630.1 hypothetical protein [Methylorubrum extorquens]MCP1581749.1 hypothetical protein [Methylorubrum extorquens]
MSDDEKSASDDLPETEAEAKIREESEFNKQWVEELKKKNEQDEIADRVPLNKHNAPGRIFGNKLKPSE